ncbi:lipopolysaccharide biosynthesis protein [Parerythrobacter lacustris]|uniref:Oligosaccharide flippase family protein n=1 Tax=Parerythrobacter lacustris TaxID=2969984 RepID=A0ABT1XRX0_9SPHN|nr:oligosaccharide flippase family protein [Parerythrobacter lacustris]MCR2834401.1 oligosaccharide flippase family protein [Parerythrobacter lacustris]
MLKTLVRQSVSVAGLRVVGTGLSVCVTIAIARWFGADVLGVYAYCIALLAIAAVPVSNGWATMLLRSVAASGKIDPVSRRMGRFGAFGAIAVAIVAGLLGLGAIWLGRSDVAVALKPLAAWVIPLLMAILLFDQISALRMSSLRGIDRPAIAQAPEMLVRPLVLLGGIAAAWICFGRDTGWHPIVVLFSSLALAALVAALFGHAILRSIAPQAAGVAQEPPKRREWIASAGALAGSAGLVQLNGYVDLLLLGNFASTVELGQYRSALQIAMLASFGYVALNMLGGQRFARLRADGDEVGLRRTSSWLARLGLLAAMPLPVVLLFAGDEVFMMLFGPAFAAAALPALIIASGLTFSAAIGMARTMLVMHHFEFLVMRTTLAALALNIVLCLALIPAYGMLGAAIANCTATVCWNALLWLLAFRKVGIDTSAVGWHPAPSTGQDPLIPE